MEQQQIEYKINLDKSQWFIATSRTEWRSAADAMLFVSAQYNNGELQSRPLSVETQCFDCKQWGIDYNVSLNDITLCGDCEYTREENEKNSRWSK